MGICPTQCKFEDLPFRESLLVALCSRKLILKAADEGESRDDPKKTYVDRAIGGRGAHSWGSTYTGKNGYSTTD